MPARLAPPARRFAWITRFSADQAGAAVVEFALGATVLFGLTMGIIDIGRAMFAVNSIEHATKEGARYAAIHGRSSIAPQGVGVTPSVQTFVTNSMSGIDTGAMMVNVVWEDPVLNTPGSSVTVSVTYPFEPIFASVLGAATFNLTAQSTYTISR